MEENTTKKTYELDHDLRMKLMKALILKSGLQYVWSDDNVNKYGDKKYEDLLEEIENQIDVEQPFTVNTLKRLNEQVKPYIQHPTEKTRTHLAHFLQRKTWEELIEDLDAILEMYGMPSDQGKSDGSSEIITVDKDETNKTLQRNDILDIRYYPDRELELEFLGGKFYRVVRSTSSKLQHNDRLTIEHLYVGMPLIVTEIKRNGLSKGCYKSNVLCGVQSVTIEHIKK